jgi:lipopolysaccharide biosynthesis glycosyltransferase
MRNACCCFIVDERYLFPTLLVAMQARRFAPIETTDIVIFCVGRQSIVTSTFADICANEDIVLKLVHKHEIDGMHIMFARFYLDRFLSTQYENVLYLDADTQISGSLASLLAAPVRPGRFLAVRDPMVLFIETPTYSWRARKQYFMSIGISDGRLGRYLNTGVLRFNRRDWADIAREALAVSAKHHHRLQFPDQDALNIVSGNDYDMISYRWNFPIFFMNCGVEDLISPRIYHFMSNPRPWDGAFQPWGRRWSEPYDKLVHSYPQIQHFRRPLRRTKYVKYLLQQHFKRVTERRKWNNKPFRELVAQLEASTVI